MPIALHIAGPPTQPHQGVGARLVRRLGSAVRSAIVSGITLAGALRRPAVSQTSRDHAEAQYLEAPAPSRVRVPNPPHPALPVPSLLPGLLARLLTRRHPGSAPISRPACLNQGNAPFTPEACPQLSPKACAVLNTPLKECDPKTLELLFSALAQHISELMLPEAGITDLEATLPNLRHRLSTALGDSTADTSVPVTPEAVPATPTDAVSDAPVVSPHQPAQAPATGPTKPSAKDAPRVSPVPLSGPPACDRPAATITAAAPGTMPDIAAPRSDTTHNLFRAGAPSAAAARFSPRRGVRDGLQCPPPWRLCYAACTGPP